MKLNFCTLFNANYLSRGLALYDSLLKVCPDFHLYVFAFDQKTFDVLRTMAFEKLTVISLNEFEDEKLLNVKPTRSGAEYCWTCTPSTILYAIQKFELQNCTYVDADMYFYSNPAVLIEEMNGKDVLITEHRYSPDYDQTASSGKYCVQFITAFNTPKGLEVMNWWRNACIEWCYARHEDGKFGDQKYLDDWTTRFDSVHELQHLGGGIAPWNVQQYSFVYKQDKLIGKELSTGKEFEAVFFHFHSLKFYSNDMVLMTDTGYSITNSILDTFFKPYVKALLEQKKKVLKLDSSFDPNGASGPSPFGEKGFATALKYYRQGLKNSKRNLFGSKLVKKLKQHYFFKVTNL